MGNGNSSKQVLLSVLGIAILVIAVVGVSFAFFTYSKTGENQLLTTGTIFFQFTDGDQISLKDQFPIPDATGAGFHTQPSGIEDSEVMVNSVMTFDVVGHDSSGKGIDYKIMAVPGAKPGAEPDPEFPDQPDKTYTRELLHDKDIKIYLKQIEHENGEKAEIIYDESYKTVSDLEDNTALNAGVLLGTGHITATSKDLQQKDKYELRMWIANTVRIGDSEDDDYTAKEFSRKYYSIKIKIDAETPVA